MRAEKRAIIAGTAQMAMRVETLTPAEGMAAT
jgi:hypothetical protein